MQLYLCARCVARGVQDDIRLDGYSYQTHSHDCHVAVKNCVWGFPPSPHTPVRPKSTALHSLDTFRVTDHLDRVMR